MKPTTASFTIAADADCRLGENPLWSEKAGCVYWTDIPSGRIHCWEAATGRHRIVYEGEPVGGFTMQENGDLLLFRVNDIALLHGDQQVSVLRHFSDDGMERFNDVIADPIGRVFAGTIGKHPQCGLYRVNLDVTITKLFAGTGCSNGMGFSPDLKSLYWTCSTTRQILRFNFDAASGELSNRRLFHKSDQNIPDGLAVDAAGCVWSARWGGGAVVRHSPDGEVLEMFQFPAPNLTSLCFGGEKLNQLFVTSAKSPDRESPHAGALFQMPVSVAGQTEFRSRIHCLPLR